ncbi:MAG TPA: methyl-accepting chemotaxis protein, partial [Nitrospirota bacterium]
MRSKNYIIRGDEESLARFNEMVKNAKESFDEACRVSEGDHKENYDEIRGLLASYDKYIADIQEDYKRTKGDIKFLDTKYSGLTTKTTDALSKLIESVGKEDGNNRVVIDAETRNIFAMLALISFVGILAAVLISIVVVKTIAKPIIRICEAASKVAEGDFTQSIDVHTDDELGMLAERFNAMSETLKGTISNIIEVARKLAASSSQLSDSSEQMARGAVDQDSQASQVAAAMEEMSATVVEVARNSAEAAESAKEASTDAAKGGDIVARTVRKMEHIAEATSQTAGIVGQLGKSSERIGEIVAVINDIADQTNLLALNAAIEAARAGEQGRGFAVVADEVRKLAERTTKATKEIAGMIRSIQGDTAGAVEAMGEGGREVEEGVELAREAGKSLGSIIDKVNNATEMIQRIAAASEQQSTASEQISGNVEGIAEVIRQNSGVSQAASSSSQELANLAKELEDMVSSFKISGDVPINKTEGLDTRRAGKSGNKRDRFLSKRAA